VPPVWRMSSCTRRYLSFARRSTQVRIWSQKKGKEKKRNEKKKKKKKRKRKEKKRKPHACLCHAVAARHKPLLYRHKLRIELVYPSCRCGHPQMTFVSIVRSAITRLLSLDYHSCTTCLYHMTSRLQRMKSERHSCNLYKPDCYESDCKDITSVM